MYFQRFKQTLLFLFILSPLSIFSQSLGCWNTLNINFDNGKKWSFSTEFQLRSLQFYKNYNYNEYKGFVTYKIMPNLQASIVLGRYTTYGNGKTFQNPKLAEEFRAALQVGLRNTLGKVQVDHRYRFEKRFYTSGIRASRIRYRVGLSMPLDKTKKTTLGVSNEFLIAITQKSKVIRYDKNRVSIGVTRKLNDVVSMQVGYLNQYDSRSVDEPGNKFFVYSLFLNLSKLNFHQHLNADN